MEKIGQGMVELGIEVPEASKEKAKAYIQKLLRPGESVTIVNQGKSVEKVIDVKWSGRKDLPGYALVITGISQQRADELMGKIKMTEITAVRQIGKIAPSDLKYEPGQFAD